MLGNMAGDQQLTGGSPVEAFLGAVILLGSLAIIVSFVGTGISRFLGGRATGFTMLGAPRVSFPASVPLALAEIAIGVSVLVLTVPSGIIAAYVAMAGAVLYAWLAFRSSRSDAAAHEGRQNSERATGQQATSAIALAGISVIAIIDSFSLTPPITRLSDPATLVWLGVLVGICGGIALWRSNSKTSRSHANVRK